MKVVFRVDSSLQIGSGHLMRCLTMAERLKKENDADVYFVMRALSGNLIDLVKQKKFLFWNCRKLDRLQHYLVMQNGLQLHRSRMQQKLLQV
ncbi:MAG: hypothetical protein ACLVLP_03810 [Phascolarctobacterium faecium]|uniref:hypothetical protein n=1 Tax=Phascolarctobacterium faecium TaxID=33025 RepID=UPI0039997BA0